VRWRKVTIIGVGLLGGSLGLAIRKRRLARHVTGYVRRRASVREAVRAGAVDSATQDLAVAVKDADLVVVCTPVSRMVSVVRDMLPHLKRGAVVTDVGSVKSDLVRKLTPLLKEAGAHFVGSHPMAGSEQNGVRAASADLFRGAVCVITPIRQTLSGAIARVSRLWSDVGATVLKLTPVEHDRFVARTSHLPHLIASVLATQVLDPRQPKVQSRLCASGFRDTTRIAGGSPEMWRDIALANRRNLARELRVFETRLAALRRMLDRNDPRALERLLSQARDLRVNWKGRANPGAAE
jgi:prephenate dehydrogenase